VPIEEKVTCYIAVVMKPGHFGKWIRNTWKGLKCGAGEGWKKSDGPIV
jgi:hypothetical protein